MLIGAWGPHRQDAQRDLAYRVAVDDVNAVPDDGLIGPLGVEQPVA